MLKAKTIKTEPEYDQALARIEKLMDALPATSEGDELELLVTQVELYEARHYAIEPPDKERAVKFRMEQQGER
nr:transcriptional regulator [Desulfobulbaceae bacterium]